MHLQLVERLMTFKKNIKKDLLVVIAYGTSVARYHAARLLFNYWPLYNANKFDRNKPKSIGNYLFYDLICIEKYRNMNKIKYIYFNHLNIFIIIFNFNVTILMLNEFDQRFIKKKKLK